MELFKEIKKSKGSVFGVVASVHQGKTNTLFNIIEEVKNNKNNTSIFCYFYHSKYKELLKGVEFFNTWEDFENLRDCVVFIDEFHTFFKLSNRHNNELVKQLLTDIEQRNIKLFLCSAVKNYNGLICDAVGNNWILKSLQLKECVNGSGLAQYLKDISGDFKGVTRLHIPVDKAYFKGVMYDIPYLKKYDKKAERVALW